MLVLILLTDIDPHLLQEESKTCPRDSVFVVVGESQNEARRQLPPRFVLPVPLRHVVINYLVIVHLDRLLVLAEQRPHQI